MVGATTSAAISIRPTSSGAQTAVVRAAGSRRHPPIARTKIAATTSTSSQIGNERLGARTISSARKDEARRALAVDVAVDHDACAMVVCGDPRSRQTCSAPAVVRVPAPLRKVWRGPHVADADVGPCAPTSTAELRCRSHALDRTTAVFQTPRYRASTGGDRPRRGGPRGYSEASPRALHVVSPDGLRFRVRVAARSTTSSSSSVRTSPSVLRMSPSRRSSSMSSRASDLVALTFEGYDLELVAGATPPPA